MNNSVIRNTYFWGRSIKSSIKIGINVKVRRKMPMPKVVNSATASTGMWFSCYLNTSSVGITLFSIYDDDEASASLVW